MTAARDIEQILSAVEDARLVLKGRLSGVLTGDQALESLAIVLDDGVMVGSLSRIRRRPIKQLRG